jgi:hypothetical protein
MFLHLGQYLCVTFVQLKLRESLRDSEVCLRAQETKLYHLGIGVQQFANAQIIPLASDRQVNEKPFKIGINSQNPPVLTHSVGRRPHFRRYHQKTP